MSTSRPHGTKLAVVWLQACILVFTYGYALAIIYWLWTGVNPWAP
jgi:hypothetical protein